MAKVQARRRTASLKEIPLGKVYQLLEPGPVVMVTTAIKGRANIMTMSWLTMMEFMPPLIGCVCSPANYSFEALSKTRECVIAIPAADLMKEVVDIGNCTGRDVDKFQTFGLSAVPGRVVKAPLIGECLSNLECWVVDTDLVDKYALFILEVVKAWNNPHRRERRIFHANGDGTFPIDGRVVNLKKKMVKWTDEID